MGVSAQLGALKGVRSTTSLISGAAILNLTLVPRLNTVFEQSEHSHCKFCMPLFHPNPLLAIRL